MQKHGLAADFAEVDDLGQIPHRYDFRARLLGQVLQSYRSALEYHKADPNMDGHALTGEEKPLRIGTVVG